MGAPVTTPDKRIELALRVEQMSEGSRELDEEIFVQLNPAEAGRLHAVPAYTSSLDSAMQLVPTGAGLRLERYWLRSGEAWRASLFEGGLPDIPRRVSTSEDAPTAPQALVAASLRALSHQGGQNG